MPRAVIIDGRPVREDEAVVSIFDRGFLYGDGVFEVMRTYGGRPFGGRAHLERLARSASQVFIELPVSLDELAAEVDQAIALSQEPECYVRVVVTRGQGPLTLDPTTAGPPLRIVLAAPLPVPAASLYEAGVAVVCVTSTRPTDHTRAAGAKASNYLANLLAQHEARQAGGYEAILLDGESGQVLEGATSNIFAVREGALCTPRLETGILGGITRRTVLEAAAALNVPVREESLFPVDLYGADEVFLTSSIRELMPVVAVDGRKVGAGVPGAVWKKLLGAYRERTLELASRD